MNNRELIIVWDHTADIKIVNNETIALLFLSPEKETKWQKSLYNQIVSGREIIPAITDQATAIYEKLVTQIGLSDTEAGKTLRSSIQSNGETSAWWYHPVAFRDGESDPTYTHILQILSILKIAKQQHAKSLTLCGAPVEIAEVLASVIKVDGIEKQNNDDLPIYDIVKISLRGFASRMKYALTAIHLLHVTRRHFNLPTEKLSAVFSGFWDWSFNADETADGGLRDRYFTTLPVNLRKRKIISTGYFAWLSPGTNFGRNAQTLKQMLAPLSGRKDVVLLQAMLRPIDVIRALFDLRPLSTYLKAWTRGNVAKVLNVDGVNWTPLFRRRLLDGFANAVIPHHKLMALAVERAAERFQPKLTLCFLEHYPASRAFYHGVSRGSPDTQRWSIQHASYNQGKTWYYLDPKLERAGHPDGCQVPVPDGLFLMGRLGLQLFKRCGYPANALRLTGSPRYDYLAEAKKKTVAVPENSSELVVLFAASLDVDLEMDTLEALCLATEGLDQIILRVRSHPSSRVEDHPRFKRWHNRVVSSKGTLYEDVNECSIIAFTYSTVAEEAILQGKPVWQWLPNGFNGSALSGIDEVLKFNSVIALRESLISFQRQPKQFTPSDELKHKVEKELFFRADGGAADRIAEECQSIIAGKKGISTQRTVGACHD